MVARITDGQPDRAWSPTAPGSPARRVFASRVLLVVPAALAACSNPFRSAPPPGAPAAAVPAPSRPTSVSGTVSAAADLNPSISLRPSPLLVRVYELKAATAFDKADFIALYNADQATLGGELVARDEFMIQPGESRPYQRTLAPETRYLAVFGAYRNLERAVWRAITPVQAGKAQKLLIQAGSLALSMAVQP
jgi:type VI secretion system protein VasD